jgi:hypothetical protein
MAQTKVLEVFLSKPYVIVPVFGSICSAPLGKTSKTSCRKQSAISRASRLYDDKKTSSWSSMRVPLEKTIGVDIKMQFSGRIGFAAWFGDFFVFGVTVSPVLCPKGFLCSQPFPTF